MPDQTNAEVSDERLREIIDGCEGVTLGPWQVREDKSGTIAVTNALATKHMGLDYYEADAAHIARLDPATVKAIVTELLTRRSVTSQASEGADDKRQKYADAIAKLHGRDLDLYFGMGKFADGVTDEQKRAAMLAFFFPKAPASPVSKRVERLEPKIEALIAAATDARNWLGNAPTGKRVDDAIADLRQALQGGRS